MFQEDEASFAHNTTTLVSHQLCSISYWQGFMWVLRLSRAVEQDALLSACLSIETLLYYYVF